MNLIMTDGGGTTKKKKEDPLSILNTPISQLLGGKTTTQPKPVINPNIPQLVPVGGTMNALLNLANSNQNKATPSPVNPLQKPITVSDQNVKPATVKTNSTTTTTTPKKTNVTQTVSPAPVTNEPIPEHIQMWLDAGQNSPINNMGIGGGTSYAQADTGRGYYDAQMEAIMGMISDMQRQQLEAQRAYERQMQAQREYMDWALSPETYNDIFGRIMQQQMPLYDSQKSEIAKLAQEQRGLADIDAESRGLYNSGVGAVMQGQISELERQEVARALAQLQSQATGLASDYQNKLLQRAQMEGDWINQSRALNQKDLAQYTDTFLGGSQLGLGYLNSDRGNQINLAQLGLDQQKIMENARQFDASQSWDMDRFAQTMGLQYKQLDLDSKLAMTNAGLRARELDLSEQRYKDDRELLTLQKDREKLADIYQAYGYINQSKQQGTTLDMLKKSLGVYKDIYGDSVYKDLIDTAESLYNPPKKTGVFGSGTTTGIGQYNQDNIPDWAKKRAGIK